MPTRKESPYKNHPLFQLRRGLLLASCIGLVLSFPLLPNLPEYEQVIWIFAPTAFFLSVLLVQADFADWRHHNSPAPQTAPQERARTTCNGTCTGGTRPRSELTPLLAVIRGQVNPAADSTHHADDESPYVWPRKWIMIADFVLGTMSFFLYYSELINLSWSPYYRLNQNPICQAYISLCTLAAAIFHSKSWWIEFMSRRKQDWEEDQRQALLEQENTDVEAAMGQRGHVDPPAMYQTGGEESRILNRILGFLRKIDDETAAEENDQAVDHGNANSNDDLDGLTPQNSLTEDDTNHTSPTSKPRASSSIVDQDQHDAILVTKKPRSKKGNSPE